MNYVQMWMFLTNKSEPLRQTSLLMLLAGGIGHGETLIHGLSALATESRGTWAGKVGQLRLLLEQGHSLSASAAMIKDLLPDQTIAAIRTAEATGTLPDVLMDEARRISQSVQKRAGGQINLESLLLMVATIGTVGFSIVSFIMLFIIPKFKEIFIGFGVALPGPTMLLIFITDWLLSWWYVLFLPLMGTSAFAIWLYYSSTSQKLRRGYHRFMEHWPRYWLPGLLRQLSLSAATGQPLSLALDCVMVDMPPGRASRKIGDLRHRVSNGEDTIAALQAVGLVRSREAAFLQSSLRTRHLDWGLRHLADAIDRQWQQRIQRIPILLGPTLILMVGFGVLFVVVSLFMPLIKLLNDLS